MKNDNDIIQDSIIIAPIKITAIDGRYAIKFDNGQCLKFEKNRIMQPEELGAIFDFVNAAYRLGYSEGCKLLNLQNKI